MRQGLDSKYGTLLQKISYLGSNFEFQSPGDIFSFIAFLFHFQSGGDFGSNVRDRVKTQRSPKCKKWPETDGERREELVREDEKKNRELSAISSLSPAFESPLLSLDTE